MFENISTSFAICVMVFLRGSIEARYIQDRTQFDGRHLAHMTEMGDNVRVDEITRNNNPSRTISDSTWLATLKAAMTVTTKEQNGHPYDHPTVSVRRSIMNGRALDSWSLFSRRNQPISLDVVKKASKSIKLPRDSYFQNRLMSARNLYSNKYGNSYKHENTTREAKLYKRLSNEGRVIAAQIREQHNSILKIKQYRMVKEIKNISVSKFVNTGYGFFNVSLTMSKDTTSKQKIIEYIDRDRRSIYKEMKTNTSASSINMTSAPRQANRQNGRTPLFVNSQIRSENNSALISNPHEPFNGMTRLSLVGRVSDPNEYMGVSKVVRNGVIGVIKPRNNWTINMKTSSVGTLVAL